MTDFERDVLRAAVIRKVAALYRKRRSARCRQIARWLR